MGELWQFFEYQIHCIIKFCDRFLFFMKIFTLRRSTMVCIDTILYETNLTHIFKCVCLLREIHGCIFVPASCFTKMYQRPQKRSSSPVKVWMRMCVLTLTSVASVVMFHIQRMRNLVT